MVSKELFGYLSWILIVGWVNPCLYCGFENKLGIFEFQNTCIFCNRLYGPWVWFLKICFILHQISLKTWTINKAHTMSIPGTITCKTKHRCWTTDLHLQSPLTITWCLASLNLTPNIKENCLYFLLQIYSISIGWKLSYTETTQYTIQINGVNVYSFYSEQYFS